MVTPSERSNTAANRAEAALILIVQILVLFSVGTATQSDPSSGMARATF
jgi:hypothetical protein